MVRNTNDRSFSQQDVDALSCLNFDANHLLTVLGLDFLIFKMKKLDQIILQLPLVNIIGKRNPLP